MSTGVAVGAGGGPGISSLGGATYDAFISYAHDDERVAVAIERGLRRLTRPLPISRRALRVFRDTASLGASSDLEGSLLDAIDRSRFFVLIASPGSAHRPWVAAEVQHWLQGHGTDGLILVLAGGTWAWDRERHRFDPADTDALPDALLGAYEVEPLLVDLRWADARSLSLRHAGFRRAVADIAAPIHGRPRDELESEDQRRRALGRALVIAFAILLAVLTVVAIVLAVRASAAERQATKRAEEAAAGRLAAEGELADHRPDLAMLLGAASLAVDDTRSNRSSLLRSMAETPLRSIMDEPASAALRWLQVAISRDGSTFATLDASGRLDVGDVTSKVVRSSLSLTVDPNDGNPKIVTARADEGGANLQAISELAVDGSGNVLLATPTGYVASVTSDGRLSGVQSSCLPLMDLDIAATADQALLGCSTTDAASWFVARYDHGQLGYTSPYDGQIVDLVLNRNADAAVAYTVPTPGSGEASHLRVIPHGDQVNASDYNVIDLVRAVAISPDGSRVALGGQTGDGEVVTVSTAGSSAPIRRVLSADPITALAFAADGNDLVTATSSGVIAAWSSSTLDGRRSWTGHEREIGRVALAADGGIVTADTGRIIGWAPAGTALASAVTGLVGPVYVVSTLPGDQVLLAAKGGYELLVGPADGPYRVVEEAEDRITAIAAADSGGDVVTGDAAGHVVVRDPASLAPRGPGVDAHEMVWDVAISPDGRTVAATYLSGATVVYDAATSAELDRLPDPTPHGRTVAFSPDGTILAVGAFDGSVALRDWRHGRELKRATPHRSGSGAASVQALTFVHAGSEVASVGSDGSVALSSVPSLDPALTLKAPTNDLRSVWVQGDLLSTIDIQGTVFTWDVASGQPVDALRSGLRTWDAALLGDGRLIAGLVDDAAAVWLLRPDAVRERACDLAARDLTADEWHRYAPGLDGPPPCRRDRSRAGRQ